MTSAKPIVRPTVPDVPDASWLACSHDGRYLYATNEQEPTGSVTALDLSGPVVLNKQSTDGGAPTHLSVHPSGRYLLTANYGSGSVAVFPVNNAIGAIVQAVERSDDLLTNIAADVHRVVEVAGAVVPPRPHTAGRGVGAQQEKLQLHRDRVVKP